MIGKPPLMVFRMRGIHHRCLPAIIQARIRRLGQWILGSF